jgi:hypothetical protein
MPIDQAFSVVSRTGAVIFDVDPLSGPKDSTSRVIDGAKILSMQLLAATAAASPLWTCHEGIWRVGTVSVYTTVVGGAAAAVQIVVCPQSVAPGSGTNQLTAGFDLTLTAPNVRFGTLITTPTLITRGDSLAAVLTGTLTGLVAALTVNLWRVG